MWEAPPPPGILSFDVDIKPASLQSASRLRKQVRERVAQQVKGATYLLAGEVEVAVTWLLHEKERYQGVHSPDIDNILKPLLDGMAGPNGLLINDCQVQSVRCSWIDWTSHGHRLQFEVRYSPDDWIPKKSLVWVEIRDKLCMPLNIDVPTELQVSTIDAWQKMYDLRHEVIQATGSFEAGRYFAFVQMPFHRARLKGFEIVPVETLRQRLKDQGART
jgi:Holliday junction resolvase RusA-like endonuclease